MLHALLIAAAIAIHASASGDWRAPLQLETLVGPALGPAAAWALTLFPLLAAWLVLHAVCARAGFDLDRGIASAGPRAGRAARRARGFICLWLAAAAMLLGPVQVLVPDTDNPRLVDELIALGGELTLLAILAAMLAATWWSIEPIDRRFRHAMLIRQLDRGEPIWALPSRRGYTLAQVRMHALWLLAPIALLLTISRVLLLGAERALPAVDADDSRLQTAISLGVIPLAIALMPALQRRVWETFPLGPGPLRDSIDGLLARARVRVRRTLVWRTHGLMANAVVLGAIPRLRYLLFTDALLEAMPLQQASAVAAHEIGHLRRHHVLWLILALLGVFSVASEVALRAFLAGGLSEGPATAAALAGAIALSLPVLAHISRRFEWQADADAARLISTSPSGPIDPTAAETVAAALGAVAALNHADPREFTWRHGSIASRQARVRALTGKEPRRLPIDRAVTCWKLAIVLVWVGLAGALTLPWPA